MSFFFFFNDTPTTEIYTLSLHDALPIFEPIQGETGVNVLAEDALQAARAACDEHGAALIFDEVQCGMGRTDRKSTRLNSSHGSISYAVFCLKKKKKRKNI